MKKKNLKDFDDRSTGASTADKYSAYTHRGGQCECLGEGENNPLIGWRWFLEVSLSHLVQSVAKKVLSLVSTTLPWLPVVFPVCLQILANYWKFQLPHVGFSRHNLYFEGESSPLPAALQLGEQLQGV